VVSATAEGCAPLNTAAATPATPATTLVSPLRIPPPAKESARTWDRAEKQQQQERARRHPRGPRPG
jgi:hypothetical protein